MCSKYHLESFSYKINLTNDDVFGLDCEEYFEIMLTFPKNQEF